jgi:hypothetical protein
MSFEIAWDCADPARMVAFWAPALGYAVAPPPQGHDTWNDYYLSIGVPEDELDLAGDGADSIVDPGGAGPRIWFQQVPEGKQVKNRLHLDVLVGGGRAVPLDERRRLVQARVDELLAAGASLLYVSDADGHYAQTLTDPEGNEFCVG